MRILIAEDDYASRMLLLKQVSKYGECDVTIDGIQTVDAFYMALDEDNPYDLIILNTMMPKIDGVKALQIIRDIEEQRNIKKKQGVNVVITTGLNEEKFVGRAFEIGCEGFLNKPITMKKIEKLMKELNISSYKSNNDF